MSSLVFGSPRRASLTVIATGDIIEFDASVAETHTNTAEVTQHPVEEGADISDHIRKMPDELAVNVIVSNHPPIILASERAQPISGFSDPASRAEDAHLFLRSVMNNDQTVDFSTTLRDYSNMAILSMGCDRDAATGNIANINMTMKEILVATTETVTPPEPVAQGRKRKVNKGKQTKSTPSKSVSEKSTSLLTDVFSAFGG